MRGILFHDVAAFIRDLERRIQQPFVSLAHFPVHPALFIRTDFSSEHIGMSAPFASLHSTPIFADILRYLFAANRISFLLDDLLEALGRSDDVHIVECFDKINDLRIFQTGIDKDSFDIRK